MDACKWLNSFKSSKGTRSVEECLNQFVLLVLVDRHSGHFVQRPHKVCELLSINLAIAVNVTHRKEQNVLLLGIS